MITSQVSQPLSLGKQPALAQGHPITGRLALLMARSDTYTTSLHLEQCLAIGHFFGGGPHIT